MLITKGLKALSLATALSLPAVQPACAAPNSSPVPFTVSTPSAVPGAVLAPGAYTIQLVSRLSGRVVLKVSGANGAVNSTFLGIENSALTKKPGGGSVDWTNSVGDTQYLRGWSFPSLRSTVEFVYPKDDAVKIATANPAKVPAVDPASEGKPADNTISRSDMEMLNLWELHLDKVGNEGGGIKAERYNAASAPKPKPVMASLPHTGSLLPLVWFAGPFLLLAAGLVRTLRITFARKSDAAAGSL